MRAKYLFTNKLNQEKINLIIDLYDTNSKKIQLISISQILGNYQSVNIKSHNKGIAIVKGREFYGSYWLIRLTVQDHEIRVRTPLDKNLSIGDRCDIKFISGKSVLLFPGSVSHVVQDEPM